MKREKWDKVRIRIRSRIRSRNIEDLVHMGE
jgi:hypothetical protein